MSFTWTSVTRFNKIPHRRLLKKLEKNQNKRETVLSDRQQRVFVKGSSSNWTDITSEVPQGSVMGTTLFLVCINGLADAEDGLAVPQGCLQFVIVVFPDHTHLLFL